MTQVLVGIASRRRTSRQVNTFESVQKRQNSNFLVIHTQCALKESNYISLIADMFQIKSI